MSLFVRKLKQHQYSCDIPTRVMYIYTVLLQNPLCTLLQGTFATEKLLCGALHRFKLSHLHLIPITGEMINIGSDNRTPTGSVIDLKKDNSFAAQLVNTGPRRRTPNASALARMHQSFKCCVVIYLDFNNYDANSSMNHNSMVLEGNGGFGLTFLCVVYRGTRLAAANPQTVGLAESYFAFRNTFFSPPEVFLLSSNYLGTDFRRSV